jgi:hypothetical protein
MLENLRFDVAETSKDDATRGAFADQLAALADVYVSDGLGILHRKQASMYDIALRLPHAAGYLVRPRSPRSVGLPWTSGGPMWWCSAARRSGTSSTRSASLRGERRYLVTSSVGDQMFEKQCGDAPVLHVVGYRERDLRYAAPAACG